MNESTQRDGAKASEGTKSAGTKTPSPLFLRIYERRVTAHSSGAVRSPLYL
jgi:hypothetical protein